MTDENKAPAKTAVIPDLKAKIEELMTLSNKEKASATFWSKLVELKELAGKL